MNYNYYKFKNFKYVDSIFRKKKTSLNRLNKLRFDRQERISPFPNTFLNKIYKNFKSEHITCYPEIGNLYKKCAKSLNVKIENILFTAGSDLAIKQCFELLIKKNDHVITIYPTYGMTNVYSKLFEAKEQKIFFEKNLFLDVNKLISAINRKTKLIVFANPNSPTGTIIPEKEIDVILKKAKKYQAFVLIDECYYGFYKKTMIRKIKKYNNLIISRSFSKAIGMAGCRVGVLISNKAIIEKFAKFRPMHEISHFSTYVAELLLDNKKIYQDYLKQTTVGKKYFEKFLKKKGLKYLKSFANFILVDFGTKKNMNKILNAAKKKKILIHGEPYIPGCENYIKFTTGPKNYMKILENLINKNLNR